MANYFDRFNQGFGSFLTPNPPPTNSYMDSLMLDDSLKALIQQQQEAQRQNMGSMFRTGLGTALLEMGAPRRTPGLDLTPLSRIIGSINQAAQTQGGMGNVFDMPMQALQYQGLAQQIQAKKPLSADTLSRYNINNIKYENIDDYANSLRELKTTISSENPYNESAQAILTNIEDTLNNIDLIKTQRAADIGFNFDDMPVEQQQALIRTPLTTKTLIERANLRNEVFKNSPGVQFTSLNKEFSGFEYEINDIFAQNNEKSDELKRLITTYNLSQGKLNRERDAYTRQLNNLPDSEKGTLVKPQTLQDARTNFANARSALSDFLMGVEQKVDTSTDGGVSPTPFPTQTKEQPEVKQEPVTEQVAADSQQNNFQQKDITIYEDDDEQVVASETKIDDKELNFNNMAKNYIERKNPNFDTAQVNAQIPNMAVKLAKEATLARKSIIQADTQINNIKKLLADEKAIKSFTVGDVPYKKGETGLIDQILRSGAVKLEELSQKSFLKEDRERYRSQIAKIISSNFFEIIRSLKQSSQSGGTGLGPLSDREGDRFDQLLGNLKGILDGDEKIIPSYETVTKNLNELIDILERNKKNVNDLYEQEYGESLY